MQKTLSLYFRRLVFPVAMVTVSIYMVDADVNNRICDRPIYGPGSRDVTAKDDGR